jgi:hypothetical protein
MGIRVANWAFSGDMRDISCAFVTRGPFLRTRLPRFALLTHTTLVEAGLHGDEPARGGEHLAEVFCSSA